jgi:hypothetical protein
VTRRPVRVRPRRTARSLRRASASVG